MFSQKDILDFSELITSVRQITTQWEQQGARPTEDLWFRGLSRSEHSLIPALYRPEIKKLEYDEVTLYERFKARAVALADTRIQSDWDWYCLAQHHGLPTRLLDWTENLLTALYFAIRAEFEDEASERRRAEKSRPRHTEHYGDSSPAIWMLDPISLNEYASGPDDGYLISVGGAITQAYLPENISERGAGNRAPLSILPSHTNQRLIAQQGTFTIHGHETTPIDELAKSGKGRSQVRIAQLRLNIEATSEFWEILELLGVSRLSLFPDLDALAAWIKTTCRY